jgi:hypothetical protein
LGEATTLQEQQQKTAQSQAQLQAQRVREQVLRHHEQTIRTHEQTLKMNEMILKSQEETKRSCVEHARRAEMKNNGPLQDGISGEGMLFPRMYQDTNPAIFTPRVFIHHNEPPIDSPAPDLWGDQLPPFPPVVYEMDMSIPHQNVVPAAEFNVWVDPEEATSSSSRRFEPLESSPPPEIENKKRKADEISVLTESEINATNEESVWSRCSSEEPTPLLRPVINEELQPAKVETPIVAPVVVPVVVVRDEQPIELPPAKRFKRFAEAVGYATLGGAAVGVGLFSVLVATAPTFA